MHNLADQAEPSGPSVADYRAQEQDERHDWRLFRTHASGPDEEAQVHLTPADTEKLLLAVAGMVARDRLARGVKLNYPETVALLTTWVIERARDGRRVADLMVAGREVLTRDQVMDGVAEMLPDVQVEATFPDGRKLVTIHQPIAVTRDGVPIPMGVPWPDVVHGPGAIRTAAGHHRAQRRPHRRRTDRAGDRQHRRPADPDRLAPAPAGREHRAGLRPGGRARVPAGHPVRHLPAVRARRVPSRRGRCLQGRPADPRHPDQDRRPSRSSRWCRSPRSEYAALYGPTVGDQVRLGDTDLWIEVEQDLTAGGEEAVFGGGKSIRESMAQGSTTRADGAPDTVITNAIVLDHWGIVRADVGIRDGRIVALGRAGNPDIADGVHPAAADRAVHRRHLRRGQDPHRRRHRHPRAPDLAVADRRGAGDRADHFGRRRHRAVARAPRPPP